VNDDNQENRPRMRYFRYAVLSLAALLVLSLGFALIPADPPEPPAPPFTEQARAAALADALELRAAGLQLAGGTADGGAAAGLDRVVTLLTIQARAFLLPEAAAASPATATPTTPAPAPAPAPASMTAAGLATALAASGTERLRDAEAADGGMARLLAGAGTAQVLAARELAAAAGSPDAVAAGGQAAPGGTANVSEAASTAPAADPGATAPATPGSPAACPLVPSRQAAASEKAQSGEQVPPPGPAGPGSALAALAAAELEAVYGYQAALARLPADAAGPASEFLRRHQDLVEDAEAASRLHCAVPPPQEPGYVLEPGFLAAPAAGLARLEAATLPAYGDVVALTDGSARTWAITGLQAAAERTVHWGGDPGAVPGILLDEARLPLLPE
jgi:hypothetical protein